MVTELNNLTLRQAYRQTVDGQEPYAIPWIVWLLENPDSPLPFPGQIYLREHDYLHLIFGLDRSSESEAFIVGFTMGLDPSTSPVHLMIFRFISQYFYPDVYKFDTIDLVSFSQGFIKGRNSRYRSLDGFDFLPYLDMKISKIRNLFGLAPASSQIVTWVEPVVLKSFYSVEFIPVTGGRAMPVHARSP